MSETGPELVRRLHMEEIERIRRDPPPAAPRPAPPTTIHFSELKEDTSGDLGAAEWNVYVREVARLLAEGNEGRWALMADGRLIGVYDTDDEVYGVIHTNQFTWPAMMKQIREQEPLLRLPFWYEWNRIAERASRAASDRPRPHQSAG